MNTLIESVNAISTIKKELNEVLRENGIEGGEVFSDYPEKFRQLFRVTEDITSSISDGYKIDYDNVITNILPPSLSVYQNIVTVTNNTEGSSLYYYIRTDSGKNNVGITALTKGTTIIVSETSTVFVYCVYRGEKSDEASTYVVWNVEVVPDPPTITREGTTVTITKASEEDIVYYSIDSSPYTLYEEAVTVERYESISAFSQNYRGRSDIVTDEAPEQPIKPEKPVLVCYTNVLTITCSTENATIYYAKRGGYFTQYTGPVTITSSDWYEAKSYKDGQFSEEPNPELYCNYIATPTAPGFNQVNNTVYIYSSSTEASILYKIDDGMYQLYTTPITLTSGTITISAKTSYQGLESDEVSQSFTYVEPVTPTAPADPTLSFNDNVITIECSTVGAVIKYRTSLADLFINYTGPIEIYNDTTIYTYSTKDGLDSNIVSDSFIYTPPVTPEVPAVPVFSCNNNIVTITCSTLNATIWYRDVNSSGSAWLEYTGPFEISETKTFIAFASKNGVDGNDSEPFTAVYNSEIIVPENVTIICDNNIVSMSCSTPGAMIKYKIDNGNWVDYVSPFTIINTITVEAYSLYGDVESKDHTTYLCYYVSDTSPLTLTILGNGYIRWYCDSYNNSISGLRDKVRKTITVRIYRGGSGSSFQSVTASTSGTDVIVYKGDIVQVYGNNTGYACYDVEGYYGAGSRFGGNVSFNVSGNIQSLIYGFDSSLYNSTTLSTPYAFCKLFADSKIKDASNLYLPATTLSERCYVSMFIGSTITKAPTILPAMTLARACYGGMFGSCYSLSTTPTLPAMTLAPQCYSNMFSHCTSLTTAPDLNATILVSACYEIMFSGCSSLNSIKCLATDISAAGCTNAWLLNTSSTGTFIKSSSMNSWPSGRSGIPNNWTIQDV